MLEGLRVRFRPTETDAAAAVRDYADSWRRVGRRYQDRSVIDVKAGGRWHHFNTGNDTHGVGVDAQLERYERERYQSKQFGSVWGNGLTLIFKYRGNSVTEVPLLAVEGRGSLSLNADNTVFDSASHQPMSPREVTRLIRRAPKPTRRVSAMQPIR